MTRSSAGYDSQQGILQITISVIQKWPNLIQNGWAFLSVVPECSSTSSQAKSHRSGFSKMKFSLLKKNF